MTKMPAALRRGSYGKLLLGMEWDPLLGRAAVVHLISGASFSTFWSYAGVWAIKALGATTGQVGLMFLLSAVLSPPAAWLGGFVSDAVGRRSVLVASTGVQSLLIVCLCLTGHSAAWGIALVVLAGVVWAPGRSAVNAIVADIVPPERQGQAYAALRTANNLGVVVGPPLASLFLFLGDWTAFLLGIALLGGLTCALAVRLLPRDRARAHRGGNAAQTARVVLTDGSLLLLLVATLLGFMVYMSFETVLPVVAVTSFGFAPETWGLLYAMNPVVVLLFQMHLTRWTRDWPASLTLSLGVLLMGPPFLLFLISHHIVAVVLVMLVFAFGEMLWVPTMQATVARLAPPHMHGAYLGGYTSSQLLAWMIAPLTGLRLEESFGDHAIWLFATALSAVSVVAGLAAVRLRHRSAPDQRTPDVPEPVHPDPSPERAS
ncbi:MFS transporter [Streptomyces sp. HUAS TT20]|uniref:MFS transporter n=1 Tax=Streptomyces sp. HUAS TT20 TaxID=3447509 RepID=UPI0021D8564F|nr:MFS transporter [Streptomyces sp. HUAS 15-9]UXY30486.1 MFS transporter [Streptomyces sp. HUAS 15-9]